MRGPVAWWNDPWRPPRFLVAITAGYLAWSLLPVLIAVAYSFNDGRSRTTLAGLFVPLVLGRQNAVGLAQRCAAHRAAADHQAGCDRDVDHRPARYAVRDRHRPLAGQAPRGCELPDAAVVRAARGAARRRAAVRDHHGGRSDSSSAPPRRSIGLVTFQVSYPAVLVRARLATIGPQYEEAAMDLGASPLGALRRIILPMLLPAMFASTVLVFADVIDDFVLVRYLSGNAATEPVSVKIYNTARAAPTPALNALATLLLLAALAAVVIGFLVYRLHDTARTPPRGPRASALRRRGVNNAPCTSAYMRLVCVLADSQVSCLAWDQWWTSTGEHSSVRPWRSAGWWRPLRSSPAAATTNKQQAATSSVVRMRINGEARQIDGGQPHVAAGHAAGAGGPDRHQEGLRPGRLRGVHDSGERAAGQLVPDAGGDARRRGDHHDRRPRSATAGCTRCNRRSSTRTRSSAATARQGRSCRASAVSRRATPDRPAEIREWMSGNICRCGAYTNIVTAVANAARTA